MVLALDVRRWIGEQQDAEGVKSGDDVYILLRLDGRVRKSGKASAHPSTVYCTVLHCSVLLCTVLSFTYHYVIQLHSVVPLCALC